MGDNGSGEIIFKNAFKIRPRLPVGYSRRAGRSPWNGFVSCCFSVTPAWGPRRRDVTVPREPAAQPRVLVPPFPGSGGKDLINGKRAQHEKAQNQTYCWRSFSSGRQVGRGSRFTARREGSPGEAGRSGAARREGMGRRPPRDGTRPLSADTVAPRAAARTPARCGWRRGPASRRRGARPGGAASAPRPGHAPARLGHAPHARPGLAPRGRGVPVAPAGPSLRPPSQSARSAACTEPGSAEARDTEGAPGGAEGACLAGAWARARVEGPLPAGERLRGRPLSAAVRRGCGLRAEGPGLPGPGRRT